MDERFEDATREGLSTARASIGELDDYVHDQPAVSIAVGVLIGVVLGFLLRGGRKTVYVRR